MTLEVLKHWTPCTYLAPDMLLSKLTWTGWTTLRGTLNQWVQGPGRSSNVTNHQHAHHKE